MVNNKLFTIKQLYEMKIALLVKPNHVEIDLSTCDICIFRPLFLTMLHLILLLKFKSIVNCVHLASHSFKMNGEKPCNNCLKRKICLACSSMLKRKLPNIPAGLISAKEIQIDPF